MKRTLCAAVVLLVFACMNFGQTKPSAGQNAVQEITALERAGLVAERQYDVSWYEHHFADSYIFTDQDGVYYDKATVVADIKNKRYKIESSSIEDLKVHVYGNAAVTTMIYAVKGTYHGKENSGSYAFTDTWVKLDGRWQIVSAHDSKLVSK